ncbi:hypothetical protein C4578_00530 [Candidatus Microgenomates bacterium]|jgi:hypothetical protein|nr:MAG: hypothetical protein C4578_00530 [Candidatus Microgenomates bacterium]
MRETEFSLERLRIAHGLGPATDSPPTSARLQRQINEATITEGRITELSESTGLRPEVVRKVVLINGMISEPKAEILSKSLGEFTKRYGREIAGIIDENYFKKDGKIFKNRTRRLINSQAP